MNIPELNRIYPGDSLDVMRQWPDTFIQTIVTSPPYWGLRDYGITGQIGKEKSPDGYISKMVEVFHECRRILKDDGTLWLNMGDSYAGSGKGQWNGTCRDPKNNKTKGMHLELPDIPHGLKPKDLCGIPWRAAFALQSDGWYLRSDIIWAKPNPMPESVTDRPTKAHEYLFLLAKSERYFYDAKAIAEPSIYMDLDREYKPQNRRPLYKDAKSYDGKHSEKQRGHGRRHAGFNDRWDLMTKFEQSSMMRNKRDVWTIATEPFPEAHFATFPPSLIKPCILAGSRSEDIVFDPFMGAGTTALVALQYNRKFLGIELNPAYIDIAEQRIVGEKNQLKICEIF